MMYIVMTVLLIALFILMIFENQLDLIVENSLLKTQDTSRNIQQEIESLVVDDFSDWETVEVSITANLADNNIKTFSIFDEEGRVLSRKGSVNDEITEATIKELQIINEALTRRAFENKSIMQKLVGQDLEISITFLFGQGQLGVLIFSLPMESIDIWLSRLYRQVFFIGVLIIFINGGFALYFFVKIFQPLSILVKASRKIEKGDLEVRVNIRQWDEIGELALAFNEMGVAIRRMHDEAKGANPLTGMPGNIRIAEEIDNRIGDHRIFAVLYSDLDNFKAYNDKYGFSKGDEAILYVRDCLTIAAGKNSEAHIFLGHEGGDDFVAVMDYEQWKPFADAFLEIFDAGVPAFYNHADARNGYIESVTRQGVPAKFPLMSISIAVVSNRYRNYEHHAELVQAAAEVKKLAKKTDGSGYAEDLRGPDA